MGRYGCFLGIDAFSVEQGKHVSVLGGEVVQFYLMQVMQVPLLCKQLGSLRCLHRIPLHLLSELIGVGLQLCVECLQPVLVVDRHAFLFSCDNVYAVLHVFLLPLQLANHVIFLEVDLTVRVLSLVDLVLQVSLEELPNHLFYTLLDGVAGHQGLKPAQLLILLPVFAGVLPQQSFIGLAEVVYDFLNGSVLLVQVRPQQVQHFLILFKRDAAALEDKLVFLGHFSLQQCLALPLQPSQLTEVEVIHIEQVVVVFEPVQLQLLSHLLHPVFTQHPQAITAFPFGLLPALGLLSLAQSPRHPASLDCELLVALEQGSEEGIEAGIEEVIMQVGHYFCIGRDVLWVWPLSSCRYSSMSRRRRGIQWTSGSMRQALQKQRCFLGCRYSTSCRRARRRVSFSHYYAGCMREIVLERDYCNIRFYYNRKRHTLPHQHQGNHPIPPLLSIRFFPYPIQRRIASLSIIISHSHSWMQQDIIIKFCVVGQPAVGKTSMLYQYVHHKFDEKVRPTIGCDFSTKLKSSVGDKPVRLQLWDIAGQERFNSVSKMYLRGALGCVIVCSAVDASTIEETIKWKTTINENAETGGDANIPCLLVMNKSDLISQESPEAHQTQKYLDEFAKNNGFFAAIQCSAKENKNVEEIFQTLLDEVNRRGGLSKSKPKTGPAKSQNIVLDNKVVGGSDKGKKKCCG